MALINCSECGKEISDKAANCPNCGNPINQQVQKEEYICCPKCRSKELHTEHKGFSGGKALAGAVLTGGIGLLAGTIGSKDVQITCLKCGNKFKAGDALSLSNIDDSEFDSKLKNIIETKGMLEATKFHKEEKGTDLATSKKYVDSLVAKSNIKPLNNSGCMVFLAFFIVSLFLLSACFITR
jgi:DNA-directed RNA polymerase subunit RPC12/RpoP